MQKSTKAIHKALHLDHEYLSATQPIYLASTFLVEKPSKSNEAGYFYSRLANPTRKALEETLASLENAQYAHCTATGMASIVLVTHLLKAGDHIITSKHLYGGTYAYFADVLPQWNIQVSFLDDLNNTEELQANLKPNTRLIWIETPSNPLFVITDLKAINQFAKAHNIMTCVDNTFLTPIFQNPLDLGIDLVMHSTTKFLNGHSDVIGGAVITNNQVLHEKLAYYNAVLGLNESPFDTWLILRGLKTLSARMKIHQDNAIAIAEYLSKHPKIKNVYYPGLANHPQRKLINNQMQGYGGVLSFVIDSEQVDIQLFTSKLKYCSLAVSLGGVETLISQPYSMSHALVPSEEKLKLGITEELFRLSVGIEDIQDLINDLEEALAS